MGWLPDPQWFTSLPVIVPQYRGCHGQCYFKAHDILMCLQPALNRHRIVFRDSLLGLQVQDRLKIRKKGRGPDVMLGRQTLLNCGAYEGFGAGCDGGDPIDVFRFMSKTGLPDESCGT